MAFGRRAADAVEDGAQRRKHEGAKGRIGAARRLAKQEGLVSEERRGGGHVALGQLRPLRPGMPGQALGIGSAPDLAADQSLDQGPDRGGRACEKERRAFLEIGVVEPAIGDDQP